MINAILPALAICCIFFVCALSIDASRGFKITAIEDLSHRSGKLGEFKALVIGINDYADPKISDLETPINDATTIAKVLKEKYGFKVELLFDRQATKAAIYKKLRSLAASTRPNDSVLIYFAGHGDFDRTYDDGWWIPADATGGRSVTYFSNLQVQMAMRSMKARHVLLISDSCYSGTFFGKSRALPPVIDDRYYLGLYNEKSRWGMTSGNKEPVSDAGSEGHSVFAYQLLKELKQSDKPFISIQEIYTQIAPIISNNSEQTPLCRPIRNTGDQGGEFVFVAAVREDPTPAGTKSKKINMEMELAFWQSIQDSDDPALFQAYLQQFPNGSFVPIAKRKLEILNPKTGTIHVSGSPYGSKVYLGGNFIGNIPVAAKIVNQGRHRIEVSADDYERQTLWVTLQPGEDKTVDVKLKRVAGGKTFTNSLGMKFVPIPAGTFVMGSPMDEKGRDNNEVQHRVTLTKGFYLQTTEVSQGQWNAVMGTNPSSFKNCGDDCPVERVSWNDVQKFIWKLNLKEGGGKYRLPTEAEWEYACRAGSTKAYSFGNDQSQLSEYAWYDRNSGGKTHPVGLKRPNKWGLYDMHGNIWEWCKDRYNYYPPNAVTNPTGPYLGSSQVIRGGSWGGDPGDVRCADRYRDTPVIRYPSQGFRLLRTE